MLGPVDLDDWQFDRRDALSMLLRRHPVIEAIAAGADPRGLDAPAAVRPGARKFAAQAFLPMTTLEELATALGVTISS